MDQTQPHASLNRKVLARTAALRKKESVRKDQVGKQYGQPHIRRQTTPQKRRTPSLAIVLVGGSIAAALIVAGFTSIPLLGEQSANSPTAADDAAVQKSPFGLAIYANADEIGKSVDIETGESGIDLGGSSGNASEVSVLMYRVNLNCVGESIDTLSYKIEGDDVSFESVAFHATENGTASPESYSLSQEFTVDYDQQHPENYLFRIRVDLRSPEMRELDTRITELCEQRDATDDQEELNRIEQELLDVERQREDLMNAGAYDFDSLNGEDIAAAYNEELLEASCAAAEKIDRATLSVTATFTDGSTETKRYRISPVENFEQVLAERLEAGKDETNADDSRLTSPLFTITEVE